ncbi:HAD-like protein [Teratosphaeria nubilosa]|uniref:HAD-like protein n=1 Tax=Teratosphaeria nubilosa TaxID=161662 RepID=A0A6G1KSV2_9PEZI|nr:HAD-like protein [Teratosphaeria nubilosa]
MTQTENLNYSAPPQTHPFTALLFDMDGTIIDSTPAITKYWMQLGHEIGIPGSKILETSHGRRSIDVLKILAPEKATWEFVCKREGEVPVKYGEDAVEIPGSRKLLEDLEAAGVPWAIVTSGTRPLVTGWLDVMRLAHPKYLVTAEEVANGKPDPACYRLGAKRLGFDDGSGDIQGEALEGGGKAEPESFLVLEDAPAGVRAGKAAGYKVLAVGTTHAVGQLREAGADWVVRDLRSVRFVGWEEGMGRVRVEVRDALVW